MRTGTTVVTVAANDNIEQEQIETWRTVVSLVTHAQQKVLEAVEDAGVPAQWYAVLHLLLTAEDHRLPMSHLAREVSFTSGGFTKLADRMGREGLIDRRNSAGDRRVVYATLTPAGLAAAKTGARAYRAALDEHVLAAVPAALLQTVAESLTPLRSVQSTLPVDHEPETVESAQTDHELPDRRSQDRRSTRAT